MKKIVCILLALVLAVCMSVAAFADETAEEGNTSFTVTFTAAKTMEKDYTPDQLSAAVDGMQPGDEVTLTFTLRNQCDSSTTWYIKNAVVESLERTETATNGAYSYVLTAIDANGNSKMMYDSDTVNGEGSALSGLGAATESLDEWNTLFDLAAGKSGKVTLKIALDGESQANQYQDTDATVELSFAAEVNSTTTSNNTTNTGIVRTGDTANLPVMVIVAGVSGLLLLGLAIWSVKARKQEKEGTRK